MLVTLFKFKKEGKAVWVEKRLVFFEGKEVSSVTPSSHSVSQETLKKNLEMINLLVKSADNLTSIEERDEIRDKIARIAKESRDLQDLTEEEKEKIKQTESKAIDRLETLIRAEIEKKIREQKYLAEKTVEKFKNWLSNTTEKTKNELIAGYEAIYREVNLTIEGFQLVFNDVNRYSVKVGQAAINGVIDLASRTYNELIEVKNSLEKKKQEVLQWAGEKKDDALKKIAELEKKINEGIKTVKDGVESTKNFAEKKYNEAKENLNRAEEYLKNCPEKFKAEALRLRNKAYEAYVEAKVGLGRAVDQVINFVTDVADRMQKVAERVNDAVGDAAEKAAETMERGVKVGIGITVLAAQEGFRLAEESINWAEAQLRLAYQEAENLVGEAKQKALQKIEELKNTIKVGTEKLKDLANKTSEFVQNQVEEAKKVWEKSVEAYKNAKKEAKDFMFAKMQEAYQVYQSLVRAGSEIATDVYNFGKDKVERAMSIAKDLEKSVEENMKNIGKGIEKGLDLAERATIYVYNKSIEVSKAKLEEAKRGYENLMNYAETLTGQAKEEIIAKAKQVKDIIDRTTLALLEATKKVKEQGEQLLAIAKQKMDEAKRAYLNAVGTTKTALKNAYERSVQIYSDVKNAIMAKAGEIVDFIDDKIEKAEEMAQVAIDTAIEAGKAVENSLSTAAKISLGVGVIVARKTYETASDALRLGERKLLELVNWVNEVGGVIKETLSDKIATIRAKLNEAKNKLNEVGEKIAKKIDEIEEKLAKGFNIAEETGDATIKDLKDWAKGVRERGKVEMADVKM